MFKEEKASTIFHRSTADSLEQVCLFFFYGYIDNLYTGKIAFAINSFLSFIFNLRVSHFKVIAFTLLFISRNP